LIGGLDAPGVDFVASDGDGIPTRAYPDHPAVIRATALPDHRDCTDRIDIIVPATQIRFRPPRGWGCDALFPSGSSTGSTVDMNAHDLGQRFRAPMMP